jgi:hypothetical protein
MQLDSRNAKHKLLIAGLLLLAFALPFLFTWSSVASLDSDALIAGGAVVGGAVPDDTSHDPISNNTAQASNVTGRSFTGVMTR